MLTHKQILENMQKRDEERKAKAEMKKKIQEKLEKDSNVKPKPKKHLKPQSKRKKNQSARIADNSVDNDEFQQPSVDDINNLHIDLDQDKLINQTETTDNLNNAMAIDQSSAETSPSPARLEFRTDQPFPLRKKLTKVEQEIVDARSVKVKQLPAEQIQDKHIKYMKRKFRYIMNRSSEDWMFKKRREKPNWQPDKDWLKTWYTSIMRSRSGERFEHKKVQDQDVQLQ